MCACVALGREITQLKEQHRQRLEELEKEKRDKKEAEQIHEQQRQRLEAVEKEKKESAQAHSREKSELERQLAAERHELGAVRGELEQRGAAGGGVLRQRRSF